MNSAIYDLIEKAKNGDQESIQKLCNLYYPQAYHYALKLCGSNSADAKDVTQETFLEVYKSIYKLRNPEFFNAWLSKIIISKSKMLFRKKKDIYMDDETLRALPSQIVKDKSFIPRSYVNDKNEQEIIKSMITSLSPKLSQVVELVYYDQMSMKEVAKKLSIPSGTVKSRLVQAKKVMKKKIIEYEKLEGRKIHFDLDVLSTSLFGFSLFSQLQTKISHMNVIQGVQIASATTFVAAGVTAGTITYQEVQNMNTVSAKEPVQEIAPRAIVSQVEEKTFECEPYQGKEIISPKAAYYTLMNWASSKDDIETKTIEEVNEINNVYEAIMSKESIYKDMLIEQEWDKNYEMKRIIQLEN